MESLNWPRLRDQCIVLLAVIAIAWALSQVLGRILHIVVVVLLAIVLAYALAPALKLGERFIPRVLAALIIYAVALGVIAGVILLVGPGLTEQAQMLALRLPGYLGHIKDVAPLSGVDVAGSLESAARSIATSALGVAEAIAGGVIDVALVLVLAFWFMVDGKRMSDFAVRLFPTEQQDQIRFVNDTVSQVLGAYIRGQLTMAAIIGFSAGLGSYLLGVHYPIVIGALAFLFELVPMVGPILASLPAIAISLFQPFPLVVYVIVFFVVMQIIENNVLAPRITGGAVGLHPVVALIAIVVGADLGGVVGALFAVPFAGVASVLIAAAWKGWHGEPVVIDRAGMRFRLPKRSKRITT